MNIHQTLSASEWALDSITRAYIRKHGTVDFTQIERVASWYTDWLTSAGVSQVTLQGNPDSTPVDTLPEKPKRGRKLK